MTWTKASHSIRFGASLIRRQVIDTQSSYPRGSYAFDGNATNDPSGAVPSGNAIASWLLVIPGVGQLNQPPAAEDPNNPTTGLIAVAENFRSMRVMQYNLTVQKEINGNVISAGYVAALTRRGLLSPNSLVGGAPGN
jgi:hypothetical protein